MMQGLCGLTIKVCCGICKSPLEALELWDPVTPQCRLLSSCAGCSMCPKSLTWWKHWSHCTGLRVCAACWIGPWSTACAHKHCMKPLQQCMWGNCRNIWNHSKDAAMLVSLSVQAISDRAVIILFFLAKLPCRAEQREGRGCMEARSPEFLFIPLNDATGRHCSDPALPNAIWWRIRLVPEKCHLCRLKWILVRSKVAYQSTD